MEKSDLFKQLGESLKPEFLEQTTDIKRAKEHHLNGGTVVHNGRKLRQMNKISFGQCWAAYEGDMTGQFIEGTFTLL